MSQSSVISDFSNKTLSCLKWSLSEKVDCRIGLFNGYTSLRISQVHDLTEKRVFKPFQLTFPDNYPITMHRAKKLNIERRHMQTMFLSTLEVRNLLDQKHVILEFVKNFSSLFDASDKCTTLFVHYLHPRYKYENAKSDVYELAKAMSPQCLRRFVVYPVFLASGEIQFTFSFEEYMYKQAQTDIYSQIKCVARVDFSFEEFRMFIQYYPVILDTFDLFENLSLRYKYTMIDVITEVLCNMMLYNDGVSKNDIYTKTSKFKHEFMKCYEQMLCFDYESNIMLLVAAREVKEEPYCNFKFSESCVSLYFNQLLKQISTLMCNTNYKLINCLAPLILKPSDCIN